MTGLRGLMLHHSVHVLEVNLHPIAWCTRDTSLMYAAIVHRVPSIHTTPAIHAVLMLQYLTALSLLLLYLA